MLVTKKRYEREKRELQQEFKKELDDLKTSFFESLKLTTEEAKEQLTLLTEVSIELDAVAARATSLIECKKVVVDLHRRLAKLEAEK